jgi:hypothetical protein
VERFIPQVISGNREARNGRCGILHLQDFFLQSHAGNQVGRSRLGSQFWIGRRGSGALSAGQRQGQKKCNQYGDSAAGEHLTFDEPL